MLLLLPVPLAPEADCVAVVCPVVELLEEPALPEMLPAVFWLDELDPEPLFEALLFATVRSLSLTFLTPGTAFAIFFASFLSSLLFTEPLSVTVPLSTAI
jgi:hypothetical protein